MNTLGSRIAHYRSLKGISQAKLAKACGWASQSRIGNYEKDTREPSLDDLELIAQVLDVTVAELIGSELTISGGLQNVEPSLQPSRGPQTYPLISWVAAGQRADSPDNFVPGVAEDWLPSTENAGPHGYWLLVKGPSMTSTTSPSFPDGTPILIRPEGFDLISGKFYIARHRDGETTFKQYIYDAGREYLVPLNAKFETVEMDDAWDIIGRVIDQKAPRGVL
ncbi:XRE family transcriptional regulator [Pseudomonas aeruginosa]|uniref:helix-turn-helix domain-containing protein n=1 Tax=Pseudomonas aeruginosa TaxID=287 RepID=UPI00249F343B|nr:XRE family transcriptional regulator [Pseudomonas aeruginosa]EIW4150762.1 helix-turn-helix domain-containing protein [Pseudomonas aeruginosa]EKU5852091.1 helix-turn-helix domain-containing protein [Pseudomonas aeruginosa]WGX57880.1 XRE family transcriptional regulator [Pseudomonas aeruginosa]